MAMANAKSPVMGVQGPEKQRDAQRYPPPFDLA
jgi:hypothetical protein